MKKIKKVLAVLLTLAIVMAMSVAAFAETKNTATITVTNAEGATLTYLQVIEPDTTSATGWKFSSESIETDYMTAFGVSDAQTAIAMLCKYVLNGSTAPEGTPSIIIDATAATADQINQALNNVMNGETFSAMTNPQEVSKAGVYAIKATEVGYTYKAMAAYIGFGTVTVEGEEGNVTYEYPSLVDATLETKKIPTTVTKEDNDENNAVAIGQTVTYTITTAFPYFNQNDTNKSFKISDTITGAEYVGLVDDTDTADVNEKTATVSIGGTNVDATFNQDGNTFELDLSGFVNDNNVNAGKPVVVTYQAKVNGVEITNTASSHIADEEIDSNTVDLYSGNITLVKVDAENLEVKLANAGFNVTKDDDKTPLTFIQKDASKNIYTYDPEGDITEVKTDANGNVVVEGLDIGTYTFTEITAPTGYSINETPTVIVLDIDDEGEAKEGEAVKVYSDDGVMKDTKLSALPSTGGMGTTLFTIGGCIIMILAAALFFVNRRRSAE